jgi:hypothetical protein
MAALGIALSLRTSAVSATYWYAFLCLVFYSAIFLHRAFNRLLAQKWGLPASGEGLRFFKPYSLTSSHVFNGPGTSSIVVFAS